MYREYRNMSGLTQDDAAAHIHVSPRSLQNYENGDTVPPADVVLRMSVVYGQPFMTQQYCRHYCAIGKAFSYVVLDNVALSPQNIMLKLITEFKEAESVMGQMVALTVNKESEQDFSLSEMANFKKCIHEFLDLEHNIETLKISLNRFVDMSLMIHEHNQKCIDKKYCLEKKKSRAFCSAK